MKVLGVLVIRCQTTLGDLSRMLPPLPITFATYKTDQWTFTLQGRTDKIKEKLSALEEKFPCEYVVYIDDTYTIQRSLPRGNKPDG